MDIFFSLFGESLLNLSSVREASDYFSHFSSSPAWALGSLVVFLLCCILILYTGVKKGIEAGNKIMMPLLLLILVFLAIKGALMSGGGEGIRFVFQPDFSQLNRKAILLALGQAFFSLSLGQGTMVTYGSYLSKKENVPGTCVPVTLFGICVSLLAGVAIFCHCFFFSRTPFFWRRVNVSNVATYFL